MEEHRMTCPLIGQIALTLAPGLANTDAGPAVRVAGYRGHDVILLNPEFSVYERLIAILDLTETREKHLLAWDVPCACSSAVQLLTA
jgi:hypothetical protein